MAIQPINIVPPSNTGLSIANGITQGATGFMQAYETARQNAIKAQIQQQQMQAISDLRRAQAAKLQEEIAPQAIGIQKVGLAMKALSAQVPGSESVLKSNLNGLFDSIQTPTQAQYVGSQIDRYKAQKVASFNQPPAAPSLGVNTNVQPASPPPSVSYPESDQGDGQTIYLNKAERDLVGRALMGQTNANIAGARNQNAIDVQNLRGYSDQQIQQLRNQFQDEINRRDNETKASIAAQNNATRLKTAQIRASAKNGANDPIVKQQLDGYQKQINDLTDKKAKLYQPNSIGISPIPQMVAPTAAMYDQQIQQIESKRDSLLKQVGKGHLVVQPQSAAPSAPIQNVSTQIPPLVAAPAQSAPQVVKWDLNPADKPSPVPGMILDTPKGQFKVIDAKGTIEPVSQ